MPFGSADRAQLQQITKQLGDLAAEIAAIRQQVADQQHTIDESRRDATTAITNGLAEVRAVARDAMTRTTDLVTGPLTQINSELVAVRSALAQIDGQLKTQASTTLAPPVATPNEPAFGPAPEQIPNPQPTPEPEPSAPEPAPESATEPAGHPEPDGEILRAAAGVSAATLHAHRDTWEFLVKHAGRDQHFHLPAEVQDASGTILAKVSGPSIVAALTSLHDVAHTADDAGTRAIAAHLHDRLTETVQDIVTRPHRGDGAEPTRIVIDDRAKDIESEEPPTSA